MGTSGACVSGVLAKPSVLGIITGPAEVDSTFYEETRFDPGSLS